MIFSKKCPLCGKTFTDTVEQYHHMRSFHDMGIEAQLKQQQNAKVYRVHKLAVNQLHYTFCGRNNPRFATNDWSKVTCGLCLDKAKEKQARESWDLYRTRKGSGKQRYSCSKGGCE